MRRIDDVFDVWFDSGSMPYAQVHYPFENREWFDTHNPADFIVEYIGQTRGWFYVMHVLGTSLFGRRAFSNVVSHGIVLGDDGQKMSKSLRNYPDVSEVFDRDGSDAMRWFLLSSPVLRGGNLIVTEAGIREGVRQVLLPLWSTWYFFSMYANSAGGAKGAGYDASWRTDSADVLDRYLLAKTGDLIRSVQARFDAFDASGAAAQLREFTDVLTNWYVRRSRDRFWEGSETDAFDTLYTVLETVCRVAAPLLPFVTENIWQGLTGGRSVHLTDWPDADQFPADADLVTTMDRVRHVTSVAQALRKAERLRVRLPLARLTLVVPDAEKLTPFALILADELNVKTVDFVEFSDDSAAEFGISKRLSVNARAAGPRLGREVQRVIAQAKAGNWSLVDGGVVVDGIALEPSEYELVLETEGGKLSQAVGLLEGSGFVLLDTQLTPELEAEGLARDAIRLVQDARKNAGFDVSDRILLGIVADGPETAVALESFSELVAAETLAIELTISQGVVARGDTTKVGSGGAVEVTVTKIN